MNVRILISALIVAISLVSLARAQTPNYLFTMCQKQNPNVNNNFYLVMFDPATGTVAREQLFGQYGNSNNSYWENAAITGIHLAVDGTFIVQMAGSWNGGTLLRTYKTTASGLNLNQYSDSLVYNDYNVGLTSICADSRKKEVLWTQAWENSAFLSVTLQASPLVSSVQYTFAANGREDSNGYYWIGNMAYNKATKTLDNFYLSSNFETGNTTVYYGSANVAKGTYSVSAPQVAPSTVAWVDYDWSADNQEFSNDGKTLYSLASYGGGLHNLVFALDYNSGLVKTPYSGIEIGSSDYYFCTGLTSAKNPCSGVAPVTPAGGK